MSFNDNKQNMPLQVCVDVYEKYPMPVTILVSFAY